MASDLPSETEVLVIGGGAIGCSVAYHLQRQGHRVVLLERARLASGASSANPGVLSIVTKQPGVALDLALASFGRFGGLTDELGADIQYEACGVLIVAETPAELSFLGELAERQRLAGATIDSVDSGDARGLNHLLSSVALGGNYSRIDAQVDPVALTHAYANAARRLGADLVEGACVTAINRGSAGEFKVTTSLGNVATEIVVNCAGADADAIGAMIGVRHAVQPRVGQMIVLRGSREMPRTKVVTARQLYAKHRGDFAAGALSFGYTLKWRSQLVILGTTNESPSAVQTPEAACAQILTYASRLMPALAKAPMLRSMRGARPFSLSGPEMGATAIPGYFVAIGHGGDGISLSAITGEYLAAVIAGEQVALSEYASQRARAYRSATLIGADGRY